MAAFVNLDNFNLNNTLLSIANALTGGTVVVTSAQTQQQTFIVSATTANSTVYSQGFVLSGNGVISNAFLGANRGGILQNVSAIMEDANAQNPTLYVHLFTAPLTTNYPDAVGLNLAQSDLINYAGYINLPSTSWNASGSGSTRILNVQNLAQTVYSSNANLYYLVETRTNNLNFSAGTAMLSFGIIKS